MANSLLYISETICTNSRIAIGKTLDSVVNKTQQLGYSPIDIDIFIIFDDETEELIHSSIYSEEESSDFLFATRKWKNILDIV